MADLEDRLRAAIARQSDDYVSPADLPDRIETRVQRRRRQRRMRRGGGLVAAAVAAAIVAVLVVPAWDDEGTIQMTNLPDLPDLTDMTAPGPSSPTSSTTGRSSSGDGSTSTTSGTTSGPSSSDATPTMDVTAQVTRRGVGPIVAGMTLRQAQTAAGRTITPHQPSIDDTPCNEAFVEGIEGLVLLVEPAADPMDSIVRATTGSVLPSVEGAQVGQTRAELLAALGQPTGTEPDTTGLGGELLVFEAEGYAYGAEVVDDMVYSLQSGDPDWVTYVDGCPVG